MAACSAAVLAALVLTLFSRAEQPTTQPNDLNSVVRATLRTDKPIVQAGRPIWVEFVLVSQTENRLTLRVPELSVDATEYTEMGLPIEHVFSSRGFSGPILEDERGERHDSKASIRPHEKVPAIKLAPHGTVGIRLDLTQYYDSLLRPGQYKLTWQPYNASICSEPLAITVLAERQAVILTDLGKITMRFHYDQAPGHVQNFIELVEKRFYDKLPFNRIIPGGLIQGGDPQGNRRGIRADGKRLAAEFNDIPFEMGTVGMCRSPQDPNSASCQFFICLGRQPTFDGKQTAFGYIVGDDSFETVRRIAAMPTEKHQGLDDYPRKPVYIRAISLENVPTRERKLEGVRSKVLTSQPTSPALENRSSSLWQRQTAPPAAAHVGGVTIVPADSADLAAPAQSVSHDQAPGNEKPVQDLPGLKARGRIGPRRPTTSTNPS